MNTDKIQDTITEKIFQHFDKYGHEPKRIVLKQKIVSILSKDFDEKRSRALPNLLMMSSFPPGTRLIPQILFFRGIRIRVVE